METTYDLDRELVIIGRPLEVPLIKGDYEAVQQVTEGRFGEFYKPDNYGRISITNRRVDRLNLSELELKSLSPDIGNLQALQWLNVDRNQLTELPESICNLQALGRLYVDGNQLTKLPESIGNLQALQELHVHGNQLTILPESICNLQALGGFMLVEIN